MALVATNLSYQHSGQQVKVTGTLAFDSSYPTGGEALSAALLGLGVIDDLQVHPTKGVAFEWDKTNAKVMAYVQGVEVGAAGAVVVDDFPVQGVAASTISMSLTSTGGSATHHFGVLKEAANTADLSTITGVRFIAWGVG